jgi:hypothetical protein
LDKAEELFRNARIKQFEHFEQDPQKTKASNQAPPSKQGYPNKKEYLIQYDNKKNKLKPSHPVYKSIEKHPLIGPEIKEMIDEEKKETSKGRFSKNSGGQTPSTQVSGNYGKMFSRNPEQLEKIDLQHVYTSQKKQGGRPNFNHNPHYQTLDPHVQGNVPSGGVYFEGPQDQMMGPSYGQFQRGNTNISQTSLTHMIQPQHKFSKKRISPSRPMQKSNIYPENQQVKRSRSKKRFKPNTSVDNRLENNSIQKIQRHNKNQSQIVQNQSRVSTLSGTGQTMGDARSRYQTISHPQINQSNVNEMPAQNPGQYSSKKPGDNVQIPENLTRSHARFKQFEQNLEHFPVKNINKLINPSNQNHTQKNIVNREVLVTNGSKRQHKNYMKKQHYKKKSTNFGQFNPIEQMKHRSKNMSDRFGKGNPKTRSTRNTQYMKNVRKNRNTMKPPVTGHFMPNNNLQSMGARPYQKSASMRTKNFTVRQMTKPNSMAITENYSKRTHTKKMSQMHKAMSKHKSVSNLHQIGKSKMSDQTGSFRNLRGSQIVKTNKFA